MRNRSTYTLGPSAARLTQSLRDIGYDFVTAVADVVDNSVSANASRVDVVVDGASLEPWVMVADDGDGMTANQLNEALRFGSRSSYSSHDLGRYGLGLKTASLSQCRSVTVASRRTGSSRTSVRQLSLDIIAEFDEWLVVDPGRCTQKVIASDQIDRGMSTVVVWTDLDRVLPGRRDTAWSRRRLDTLSSRLVGHLSMVFHRFLEADAARPVTITVNGEKLTGWDPFATSESRTSELQTQTFEVSDGDVAGTVTLRRFVLPPREQFSSLDQFDKLAGPLKWNRQQGLYVYRAERLIQWGGWAGLRAIDEHTKLARASLEYDTNLDNSFTINVAKVKVSLPPGLRQMLDRPVGELCQAAETVYRRSSIRSRRQDDTRADKDTGPFVRSVSGEVGLSLLAAAARVGELDALRAIVQVIRQDQPELADALGLADL